VSILFWFFFFCFSLRLLYLLGFVFLFGRIFRRSSSAYFFFYFFIPGRLSVSGRTLWSSATNKSKNEVDQSSHAKFDETQSEGGVEGVNQVPFAKIVEGVPRYEVCRRFLTTLFLTNQGNLDIHFENEAERINGFSVSVIKAEKEWLSFEEEDAAAVPVQDGETETKKAGRTKKSSPNSPAAAEAATTTKPGRPKKSAPAEDEDKEPEGADEPLRKKRRSSSTQKVSTTAATGSRKMKAGA